jgi:hypothetical protein
MKLLLLLLVISLSNIYSQTDYNEKFFDNNLIESIKKENLDFKNCYSIYFTSGMFIPTKFYKDYNIGTDLNIGVQKDVSESFSMCLDIDLAFAKESSIYYTNWMTYLQLEFGFKHRIPITEKFKFFIGPKFGTSLLKVRKEAFSFQSFIPLCVSLETGLQHNLNNNFSVLFKVNYNLKLRVKFDPTELDNYFLINGGICYKF